MSHIIKGNADISNLDVSNTAKIRGKNVTTSVNGVVADALGRIIIEVGFPKDSLDVIKNGNILSNFYKEGFYELKIDDISTVIDFPSENIKGTGIMFVYILDNVKYQYIIDEECNTAIRKDLESQWFTNINTETVFDELKKYVLVTEFNKKISEIQTELEKLENNKFNTSNVVHDITKNTKSTVPSSFATFNLLKDSFRKLGDIGSKNLNEFKYIDENSDLGMYTQTDDDLATTENNYPFKKKGILMIYPNGIAGTQIYYPNNEPFYYKRDSISIDEFGVWVKFGIEYSTDPNIISELNKKIDKEEALNSFVGIGMYENAFGSNISDINLDINNAKTNKTFFVYGQHTNNIPDNITGSGLTFSGFYTDKNMSNSYSIQLVGAYSVDDMMLFRTYNGDSKSWNQWRQFASVEYIKEFAQNGTSELHLSSKNGKNSYIFHRDSDQTFGLWSNIEKKSIFRVDGKGVLYTAGSGEFDGEIIGKGRIQINSGVDEYTKLYLNKPNKKYVLFETKPDEHDSFLGVILNNSDHSLDTQFRFPKESGIQYVASRQWILDKNYIPQGSTGITLKTDTAELRIEEESPAKDGRWRFSQKSNKTESWTRLTLPATGGQLATENYVNNLVSRVGADTYIHTPDNKYWAAITNTGMFSVWDNVKKMRNFYVENDGTAVASKQFRASAFIATRTSGSEELIKLGFNATGSPFLSYYDTDKKWTAYYFPNTNGGTVATQDWVNKIYYKRDDSPTFKWQINIGYKDGGANYAQLSYESNEARWSVNNGSWKILKHPLENGTVATREWSNSNFSTKNIFDSNGNEAHMWTGDKTAYMFVNNARNSGFFDHKGNKYIWGFGADGSMKAGLIPVANGGTGATNVSNARNNLQVYSKSETDNKYFLKSGGTVNGNITSTGNIQGNVFLQPVQSGQWISLKTSRCYTQSGTVSSGSAAPALRQEHADRFYMLAGLGNSQFGIYMINKSTTNNQTDGGAYLNQSGDWVGNRNGSFIDVEIRSDIRSKDNIKLITSPLEKINQISGYTYNVYTDNKQNSQKSAGVIAQEVIKVLPEIVRHDDDTDLYKVTYNGITALLVESVKELSENVKHLEGIIKNKGY